MSVRGIRGAITVEANEKEQMLQATLELLNEIVKQNAIDPSDIGSVFITVTQDLDDTFPAIAIRQMAGWDLVPLMCALEVPVKGSLERCIRFMIHYNTDKSQAEINHVYLAGARVLRPDLSKKS
ncbi:chorismate mutase [Paenibacillus lupini]|jgi:chorismate mutase|uniref:chorismate mutase n=1 Tax=Paenibacillus lupini TaxID=1450204 RepID=UPI00141DBCA5|nr:chorismate mutase [Paenibacillus lupini]